jgi:hypothetical protein
VQRKALDPPEEAHRGPTHVVTGRHRPGPGPEEREEEHRHATESLTLQRAMVASPTPAKTEVVPDDPTKKEACGPSMLAGMQKKAADGSGPAPAHVQSTVDQARAGGGTPLSPETRADMESRLGRDFGGVRVHSGAPAAAAAQAVGAKAFTVGNDVFFGAGRYRPETDGGKRLLAHELVHTVQQGGGSARARPARLQRATKKALATSKAESETNKKSAIAKDTEKPDDRVFEHKQKGRIEATPPEENTKKKGRITLPVLQLPKVLNDFKGTADHTEPGLQGQPAKDKAPIEKNKPWTYKGRTERSTSERAYETWVKGMVKAGSLPSIRSKIPQLENAQKPSVMLRPSDKARVYYLIPKGEKLADPTVLMTGTLDELLDDKRLTDRSSPSHRMLVPLWHKNTKQTPGALQYYDADHIMEEQLGGADSVENMWLWESKSNQRSGSSIYNAINSQAKALIDAAGAQFWKGAGINPPEPKEEVRNDWILEFKTVGQLPGEYSKLHWMRDDILKAAHLERLRTVDDKELAREGFRITDSNKKTLPDQVHVFTNPAGGEHRRFVRKPGSTLKKPIYQLGSGEGGLLYRGFRLKDPSNIPYEALDPTVEKRATLIGTAFGKAKVGKETGKRKRITVSTPLELDVLPSPDLGFGGYVDKKQILAAVRARATQIPGASPFEVTDAGINENGELYADGSVTATKALFPGFKFDVSLRGDTIYVDAPIPAAAINFGPIHVTDAALRLGANDDGVFIEGGASLVIDGLGSGHLTAAVSGGDVQITGFFDFDVGFLKNTEVKFEYDYETDAFKITLERDVPAGALPGIAGGHISATLSRGAAAGSAEESPKQEAAPAQPAQPQMAGAPGATAAPGGAAGAGAGAPIGVGLSGELKLAGPLSGSTLQVTWDPKLGIVFAAQDIPLPVGKIPGVQDAMVSITARRDPETGAWHVSGAGGASFQIAGVDGKLLVAVDGAAITIQGTGGFQKGLAKGSVTILATNLQRDADGNPAPDKTTDKFTVSGKGAAEV